MNNYLHQRLNDWLTDCYEEISSIDAMTKLNNVLIASMRRKVGRLLDGGDDDFNEDDT